MVSGSLTLLYLEMAFSWFAWGKQGSGPNRGLSPVEWGDFRFVVCPSVHSPLWAIQHGPFYMTSSPIGAIAQKKRSEKKEDKRTSSVRTTMCPNE